MRFQQVLRLTSNLEQTRQMYLKLCTLGGVREQFVQVVSILRMPYVVFCRRFVVCEEQWIFAVNQ